jgi:hypothetical protein
MSDWAVGLANGLGFGSRQKPWAELTNKEKRVIIVLIAAGVVLLVAGIVVFFLVDKQL